MVQENTTGSARTETHFYLTDTELGGLLAARVSIGSAQASVTSGRTLDYPVVEASPKTLVRYDMIKMSVLENTLIEASYLFTVTMHNLTRADKRHLSLGRQAYAFLTGTGLEIMLEEFGIAMDADEIRQQFSRRFGAKIE